MLSAVPGTHPYARPRLMLRAAEAGQPHYRRGPALRRLLALPAPPPHSIATALLRDAEAAFETRRRQGDPAYRPSRHLAVMIALLAETRAVAATAVPAAAPAPAPSPVAALLPA